MKKHIAILLLAALIPAALLTACAKQAANAPDPADVLTYDELMDLATMSAFYEPIEIYKSFSQQWRRTKAWINNMAVVKCEVLSVDYYYGRNTDVRTTGGHTMAEVRVNDVVDDYNTAQLKPGQTLQIRQRSYIGFENDEDRFAFFSEKLGKPISNIEELDAAGGGEFKLVPVKGIDYNFHIMPNEYPLKAGDSYTLLLCGRYAPDGSIEHYSANDIRPVLPKASFADFIKANDFGFDPYYIKLADELAALLDPTAVPTTDRNTEPLAPPNILCEGFDSYAGLAEAITDKSSSSYERLRTDPYSQGVEELGPAYNDLIAGLESGEMSLPMPYFNGELAKLVELDASIAVFSSEKFNLPCIWYYVDCDGVMVTVEVFPLSLANEIKLTGSETYSDISKKLAPLYPTEDTPKEQYSEYCSSVTARELELAEGRRVWATILEETPYDNDYRESYRFLYDGFIVNIWKWNKLNDPSDRLTDDFFKAFSLGGDLVKTDALPTVPTSTMQLTPHGPIAAGTFDSYEELAEAIMSSKSSAYNTLRGDSDSGGGLEALGSVYKTFINKLEGRELIFPVPELDGKTATLKQSAEHPPVYFISRDLFELPTIGYRVEHNGLSVEIDVVPLSIVDQLKLTGSETYSEISAKLNPQYYTENTPKEQYIELYSSITAREIELYDGRKVQATIFVNQPTNDGVAIQGYLFLYNSFIVNVRSFETPDEASAKLTDDFFKAFSLGGDLTSLYKQA